MKPITSNKLFNDLAYGALDWPGKSVRLERGSLEDYRQRPASARVSIAELYHENSKLFPRMVSELAAHQLDAGEVRREFLKRRSKATEDAPSIGLAAPWQELLESVAPLTGSELLYAIELRLITGGDLIAHEPVLNRAQVIKRLSEQDRTRVRQALRLLSDAGEGPLLFVCGSFARNDLLYGPRGYRRTLLEAGRVTQTLLLLAARLGLPTRVHSEFADREIDAVLEADGVEEGVIAVIEVGA